MSTTTTTYVTITLADAQPGDQVWQAGAWQTVAAFHLFGSSVKLVWPNGSTHAMPASHCPTIRRAITTQEEAPTYCPICGTYTGGASCPREAQPVATHLLGAHTHYLGGADTLCSELTHCPSLCACPVDACTAELVTL